MSMRLVHRLGRLEGRRVCPSPASWALSEFRLFSMHLRTFSMLWTIHSDALRTWLLVSERDLLLNYVLHVDSFVEDILPCRETGLVQRRALRLSPAPSL